MIMEAIGKSLPMAVGVTLSPLPVAAVMMILMATQATTSAPAFLLSWILGILTVGVVVFLGRVSIPPVVNQLRCRA